MKSKYLTFNIILTAILVISAIGFVNYQTNILRNEILSLQKDYDSKFNSISIIINDEMVSVDKLVDNIQQENDAIRSLIALAQIENQENIAQTKLDLLLDISEIERDITIAESNDLTTIIQASLKSVVSVLTNTGQGSGAFVTEDGNIVTNYHVVRGAKNIRITTYDDQVFKAKLKGFDPGKDVAVLTIDSEDKFREIKFTDSDLAKTGETVLALGNPFGLDFTATQGIISAKRTANSGTEYLQIDVPINPGNSGGPIIDATGALLGIANFKIQGGDGIGFAITSNEIKKSIENIILLISL